jgi:hypothetical protein
MAKPTDKNGTVTQQPATDEGRPGRVEVDARGRNVWRWARAGIDSTSVLLKGLENKDLALEPTQKVPIVPDRAAQNRPRPSADPRTNKASGAKTQVGAKPGQKRPQAAHPARKDHRPDRDGGFDPYNSR